MCVSCQEEVVRRENDLETLRLFESHARDVSKEREPLVELLSLATSSAERACCRALSTCMVYVGHLTTRSVLSALSFPRDAGMAFL